MQLLNEIITSLSSIINTISFLDLIDIAVVTLLIYNGALLIKDSRAAKVLKGIAAFFGLYGIVAMLDLKTMNFILNGMLQFGVLAIIIVFQPELRRFLEGVGNKGFLNYIRVFQKSKKNSDNEKIIRTINGIVTAVDIMSRNKMGVLLVLEQNIDLGDIKRTGVQLDAMVQEELLGAIFYHNAPLHDGAVLIRDNRIVAAGCFLPLSQNQSISKSLGTRHRAALGISESSDALVIVVSEETGKISIAKNGGLHRGFTREQLKSRLMEELLYEKQGEKVNTATETKSSLPEVDASYFNESQDKEEKKENFLLTDEEVAILLEHDGYVLEEKEEKNAD